MLVMLVLPSVTRAQLAPMGSIYFQNQYLNNPAFAGLEGGLNINAGYRQQWSNFPGSPKIQVVTADYAPTERVGLGITLNNEQAGLFKRTRVIGSYAYHLPLNSEGNKLSFGASFGMLDERVDFSRYDGDPGDNAVKNFNQRGQYLDGDFGIAYTSGSLNIQGSLPNLRNTFGFDNNVGQEVNDPRLFVAASYRFDLPESWDASLEPKVAYRLVKGFDDIMDVGGNLAFANGKVGLMAMYHSSKATSFGFSSQLSRTFNLMGFYTTNTAALAGQSNGNFELNLRISLFDK